MALPIWWQATTPHEDIRRGKFSEAVFAADLGNVIHGNAPQEYLDPVLFFQKTYMTQGLRTLIENVGERLSEGSGDSVIQLQTPFGGGKTHALITLYHAMKNYKQIEHVLSDQGLSAIEANVCGFIGTHADPISGRTPWGEIAYQLGRYKVVKEHDQKRISPGKEVIEKMLGNIGPTIILFDEVLEYIVKANRHEKVESITPGQTYAFLQEMSEYAATAKDCVFIVTLPASILESYDEAAEKALRKMQNVVGRVESIYTPVEGWELYEVIRQRLFEDYGTPKVRREVAEAYFDMYQKLGASVPSDVRDVEYRKKIEKAYPFHPELIDVLYERWGSFPTFQRTRGALRLLAEVVADLYERQVATPLIQSSMINLGKQSIRREIIKHIGNEFDSVIASDIAGENAKSPKIDKEMGSEFEKYWIAQGVATAIFMYSFSGGISQHTTLPRTRVALLREGIPSSIVGDAVAKIGELWYFHPENNQYAFRNEPNLEKVIVDTEETISGSQIKEELKNLLKTHSGKEMEVYLWPEKSADIPDNKNIKMAVLSPDYVWDADKGDELIRDIFKYSGAGFRVYKNTLFVLQMDSNQHYALSNSLRRILALRRLLDKKSTFQHLSQSKKTELNNKLKTSEKEFPFNILSAHRYLANQGSETINKADLGLPTVGADQSLSQRVKNYLQNQEKILTKLTPKYIVAKTFAPDEEEKPLRDIYDLFLKTPGYPLLENEEVLKQTVREGVKNGLIGLRMNNSIYYKNDSQPDVDAYVLLKAKAEKALEKSRDRESQESGVEGGEQKTPKPTPGSGVEETIGASGTTKASDEKGAIHKINFEATVPWDKLSQMVGGVIRPLKEKGDPPKITVRIESEGNFDRSTLDTKVRETLLQIGADITEWNEE